MAVGESCTHRILGNCAQVFPPPCTVIRRVSQVLFSFPNQTADLFRILLAGVIFFAGIGLLPAAAEPLPWDLLKDGLRIALWIPPLTCPNVPPLIAIEIDPDRYRFAVHYYRNDRFDEPPDIQEWQTRTGHDLVFNAGLFRENFAYLGLLYGEGRSLGGKQHATWLGLFAAEPTVSSTAPARIMDLAVESFDEQRPPYREAAQSLMLLDQTGKIRVRRTGKMAQQTIVAEQENGKILLFKTTQSAGLYEIGQCLHQSFPTVRRAMAMDGGSSSDFALAARLNQAASTSRTAPAWKPFLNETGSIHIGLPAIIGISPRPERSRPSIVQQQPERR